MDVNALQTFSLDASFAAELERLAADNLKRCRMIPAQSSADWYAPEAQDMSHIGSFVETKTIWHPARI
jgi:hypothetical protein